MARFFAVCGVVFFSALFNFSARAQDDTFNYVPLSAPGATDTYPYGISGDSIVGVYQTSKPHGFLYNMVSGNWATLTAPFSGSSQTTPQGVDGSNIVGAYSTGSDYNGFLFDGASWTSFSAAVNGGVSGATQTNAWGISGNNIVGSYIKMVGINAEYNGFVYDHAAGVDGWATINMPGAVSTMAIGIDGNNVVGQYSVDGSVWQGFLYNSTARTWQTLNMTGAADTYPHGISGSDVVGYFDDGLGKNFGFTYDIETGIYTSLDYTSPPPTEMQSLSRFSSLAESSPAQSSGVDTIAYGIDGPNIVGTYGDPDGFILQIGGSGAQTPEPSTILLLAGILFVSGAILYCQKK